MDNLNTEFVRLMSAAGWTQAETARRLGITSGAVNQFVKGASRPSATTLQLLRLKVFAERPQIMHYEVAPDDRLLDLRLREKPRTGKAESALDWETRVIDMLAPLAEENRNRVLSVLEAMVECLSPARIKKK